MLLFLLYAWWQSRKSKIHEEKERVQEIQGAGKS